MLRLLPRGRRERRKRKVAREREDLISAKFDFLRKKLFSNPPGDFLKSSHTDVNNVDLPLDLIPTPFYLLHFFSVEFLGFSTLLEPSQKSWSSSTIEILLIFSSLRIPNYLLAVSSNVHFFLHWSLMVDSFFSF